VKQPATKRTVLLLDDDPAVARVVQASLRGPTCRVAVGRVDEGEGAPDLVVIAASTEDAGELALARQYIGHGCAVAVLLDEESAVRTFTAIQLGAWECLVKPLKPDRLARRVAAIFKRLERRERPQPVNGPSTEELLDLLEQVEREALSGRLELDRPGQQARLEFAFGDLQLAEHGTLRGQQALAAIAGHGDWRFLFREGGSTDRDHPDTATTRRAHVRIPPQARRDSQRAVFGPVHTGPGPDPHTLETRKAALAPAKTRPYGPAARPGEAKDGLLRATAAEAELLRELDGATTEEVSEDPLNEEFMSEDTTQPDFHYPNAPLDDAYDDMKLVYADEDPDKIRGSS
jgi:DNA-binding response OmpR family regulator